MVFNHLECGRSGVVRISAQVLMRWTGALNHDGIEHRFELPDVMPVGSGHDERQRHATPVHQRMAFAPIFSPDPSVWGLRFVVPLALSSLPRRCFATPKQFSRIRRIRQGSISTAPQRPLLCPIAESGYGLRWHCRSVLREELCTDSLCIERTRCPQTPIADLWACTRPALSGMSLICRLLMGWDQWLNTTPKFTSDFPCLCLCHLHSTRGNRAWEVTILYLRINSKSSQYGTSDIELSEEIHFFLSVR